MLESACKSMLWRNVEQELRWMWSKMGPGLSADEIHMPVLGGSLPMQCDAPDNLRS